MTEETITELQTIDHGESMWDVKVNRNFDALKKLAGDEIGIAKVTYTKNYATVLNGASNDGNGLYQITLKNGWKLNVFDILNLYVPRSAVNTGVIVLRFPEGTLGSHVRFSLDQGTNMDINANEGKVVSNETQYGNLQSLCGEYVWFTKD